MPKIARGYPYHGRMGPKGSRMCHIGQWVEEVGVPGRGWPRRAVAPGERVGGVGTSAFKTVVLKTTYYRYLKTKHLHTHCVITKLAFLALRAG